MPLCCRLQAQGDSLSWAANSSLNFFAHLTSMKQVAPVHSAGAWAGARARQAMGPPMPTPFTNGRATIYEIYGIRFFPSNKHETYFFLKKMIAFWRLDW